MFSRWLPVFPCLFLIAAASCLRAAEPPAPPNVIFILADDLGWADIGYHGSEIQTPHLDRLAAAGAKLEQYYVYPTCSPTRVALLSGRYPSRFGVFTPLASTTKMMGEDARLPQELRRLGYRTHISGKWHIGETPEHRPLHYGFDTTYGYLRGQIDPYTHRYKAGDHVTWHRNDTFVEEEGHVTDLITREAIRVVRESGDEPFFLYVAHHSPHYPLNEPPKWIAPYKKTIADPSRRHFAAAVTHLDDGVGQIIAALEASGKAENTLVIFSSDNGGQQRWIPSEKHYNGRYAPNPTLGNNLPLRGWKTDLYEGGIRVPAFVHWPGVIDSGRTIRVPTHICDWAATLIGLAGGEVDDSWNLDGIDIASLLTGREDDNAASPRTLYWRTKTGLAVREGDWKLITAAKGDKAELFHLGDDPYETKNLADDESERVAALREKLRAIRANDNPR
ncbi:MAG: arylsulfatase [Verrucomicrobiaceae bacterium]|nr:arylsulfatase [Verrucomicrobiaceae bacterium]